jgi:hypothetical protein
MPRSIVSRPKGAEPGIFVGRGFSRDNCAQLRLGALAPEVP